jgi:hypothetical protein
MCMHSRRKSNDLEIRRKLRDLHVNVFVKQRHRESSMVACRWTMKENRRMTTRKIKP